MQTADAAAISVGCIHTGQARSGDPVCGSYVEDGVGSPRTGYFGRRQGCIGTSLRLPLAITAISYDPHPRCHGHLLPDRVTWFLRVFGGG